MAGYSPTVFQEVSEFIYFFNISNRKQVLRKFGDLDRIGEELLVTVVDILDFQIVSYIWNRYLYSFIMHSMSNKSIHYTSHLLLM